jgi:uncharacterized protein (UPF0335 family)
MGTNKSKDAVPLKREQAEKLYEHVRAIESLEADKADIQADITMKKTLVTETLPVQKDVLDFVLKRRKHSKGILSNFDTMLELVEEALAEVEGDHAEDARERIAAAHNKHRAPVQGTLDVDGPEDDENEDDDDGGAPNVDGDPDGDNDRQAAVNDRDGLEPVY